MMDEDSPAEKRRRGLDLDKCILCSQTLIKNKGDEDIVVHSPRTSGLKKILDVTERRNDDVWRSIGPFKEEILQLNIKVRFHYKCRANYTSEENLRWVLQKQSSSVVSDRSVSVTPETLPLSLDKHYTRTESPSFNIREHCFICGKSHTLRKKLTQISTGDGSDTCSKVLRAARRRHDTDVELRMILYPDLFAYDAKYHRECLGPYLTERNILSAERIYAATAVEPGRLPMYEHAVQILVEELVRGFDSANNAQVEIFSNVHMRFIDILRSVGGENPEASEPRKLKKKIQNTCSKLSFIPNPGKSDIICCSDLSVGEVLRMAQEIDGCECDEEIGLLPTDQNDRKTPKSMNETHVLHVAAGIIRDCVSTVDNTSEFFPSFHYISAMDCRKFVPDKLFNFIRWILNKESYNQVNTIHEEPNENMNLKIVAICHDIIAASNNGQHTPLTFGIAVQLHHDFGSRQLLDELSSLGHCAPYGEVRRFLTSTGEECASANRDDSTVFGLASIADASRIHDAIDNFDLNEETINGKNTTHAMASVIYQDFSDNVTFQKITRKRRKSLSGTEACEEPICPYSKPHKRPEPATIGRDDVLSLNKLSDSYCKNEALNLVWTLSRRFGSNDQHVPSWSGFNSVINDSTLAVSTVRYLPFTNAPPTDLSTVYHTLKNLVSIADKLGQDHILVTADMAIYKKAQEIVWSKPEGIDGKVTMRIGGMHLAMSFISAIGKLYSDGGLLSLLVDSDAYALLTAQEMLRGKQYSRALRGMMLVVEALYRVFLNGACAWMAATNRSLISEHIDTVLQKIDKGFQSRELDDIVSNIDELVSNTKEVAKQLQEFAVVGRDASLTFKYWHDLLEGGLILLRLVRADRDNNFFLHLDALKQTVPWFVAAGKINYAKWTPIYIAEMLQLESSHPESFQHMQDGAFVVRRSSNSFNGVPTDQGLEQSVNRECKSRGGIVGFTMRKGARLRWILTRHVSGRYASAVKSLFDSEPTSRKHEELSPRRISRDEHNFSRMVTLLEDDWQNPFDLNTVPKNLTNIATGLVASSKIEGSLSMCLETASQIAEKFVKTRVTTCPRIVSFWDRVPQTKTYTFANMKKTISPSGQEIIIDTEVLFRRLLAVAKNRDVSLEAVLSHELAALPPRDAGAAGAAGASAPPIISQSGGGGDNSSYWLAE